MICFFFVKKQNDTRPFLQVTAAQYSSSFWMALQIIEAPVSSFYPNIMKK
jgi:hypothetical protein